MKDNKFKPLIITVAILLCVIVITIASGGASMIANMLGFVAAPMQKVSATATENTLEFFDLDSMTKEELKAMNKQLSEDNYELRNQVIDYYDMQKELEQLKKQLDITEERPDMKYVPSSVILRDPNDPFYGFSIDKGSLAGVTENAPVITENGLVGVVDKVYATTSTVKCIFSEEMRVAAISKEFDESGVITSSVFMAGSGTLQMNYLAHDTLLEEGTIITTSGASATFPADLVIGYVLSVEPSEKDVSKVAIIKPYEDLKTVKDVFVITGFPGKDEDVPEGDFEGAPVPDEDAEPGGDE